MNSLIYYINNRDERIDLDKWPLAVTDLTQLFHRKWDAQVVDNIPRNRAKLQYIYRTTTEFSLDISIYADSAEEYIEIANSFEAVTDYDLRQKTLGRLYVGDYYLECFLRDEDPAEYEEMFDTVDITLTVYSVYPHWVREISEHFSGEDGSGGGEEYEPIPPYVSGGTFDEKIDPEFIRLDNPKDYALESPVRVWYSEKDYMYDFGPPKSTGLFVNDSDGACDFIMTIWGPAVNPSVSINGHIYQIDATIPAGSYVVIDSRYQTVTEYDRYGNFVANLFNARYKTESIFEQIDPGTQQLSSPCAVDLILFDERSTPAWSF